LFAGENDEKSHLCTKIKLWNVASSLCWELHYITCAR
jgi:hypothetical protein